ncbi:MAG: class I SAM-dependent methyltransferase [Actinomycetota bacterium]|nr:class I SAM-dependent methyltransferase [Actinomycetota bacterium]MDQ6910392.1 class I SAM-dependent methyltransferase [Actinomycetota bacterium]
MDRRVRENRIAWDVAAQKYVVETEALVEATRRRPASLSLREEEILAPFLAEARLVIHLQTGHGLDDVDLARAGVTVVGVDFSIVATRAAQGRARQLALPIHYLVADCAAVPLRPGWADLVYTGKGALNWVSDLELWAEAVAGLLRPGGRLFVFEAHPAVALWNLDPVEAGLEPGGNYFTGTRINASFPASAIERYGGDGLEAVEWQWSLADVVNAVIAAGLSLEHLGEYPEPFWRPEGSRGAAAWDGRLPNTFSLLARRA